MDFGKLPEHIYERSVYKVIHTTEYQNKTIDGAGLGADCAILPSGEGFLVTTQATAQGMDKTVGVRALQHGINCFATAGITADVAYIYAQLNLAIPHMDSKDKAENYMESYIRDIIRLVSDSALNQKVTIIGADVQVVPAIQTALATITLTSQIKDQSMLLHKAARAKQDVVMTKWLGLEGTSLIASRKKDELASRYPIGLIEEAADFDMYLSIVPEAATAAQSGVSAMQAVREGGIFGGLWQLAEVNGVGLVIDLKKIPVKQETIEVCEFYDVNPYELLSGGSLLMTSDNGARLASMLIERGIPAAVIGQTTDNHDRILVNDGEKRFLEPARHDSLYKVLITP